MDRKKFVLALALIPSLASAQGLFGLGDAAESPVPQVPVTVTGVPDAHWNFEPDADGAHWKVGHYSPNLDGLGFANRGRDGRGACYGHSLLSLRWFQYITKPLKNGTLSRITPDEFRDFWGGHMAYPVSHDITPANVDEERLQPYSVFNDRARTAIGRLVGLYQDYTNNVWDHGRELYDEADDFRTDLVRSLDGRQLPPSLYIKGSGVAHAMAAFRVDRGTAMMGNTGGATGTRKQAYRIRVYDPNVPGDGDGSHDDTYAIKYNFIVFEDAGGFVGMSEQFEAMYGGWFLRQSTSDATGTWHIPGDNYGIEDTTEGDGGELRSWFPGSCSDAEGRVISGLDPVPSAD